jgi:hypothetical protein
MTQLSPRAQKVFDAAMQYEINPECCSREIAVAVLRAAADQVVPGAPDMDDKLMVIRYRLCSIADELAAQ